MGIQPQFLTREQKLIEAIKGWTNESLIGDDCAVLPSLTGTIIATSDSLVEDTHFRLSTIKLEDLGWKAVAANLSDIAAMAGCPHFILANIALPKHISDTQVRKFFLAMLDCAATFKVRIVGGDLSRSKILVLSLTVLGTAHEKGCLKRSGARADDVVVVTGDFGASAAGLWLLENNFSGNSRLRYAHCLSKHLRPIPRLAEAWALVRETGNKGALMDASDGLADALAQIARASNIGMEIDANAVPIHKETLEIAHLSQKDPLELALYGGEDYELVACLSQAAWHNLQKLPDNPFRVIGKVTSSNSLVLLGSSGQKSCQLDLKQVFQHWK